MTQDANAPAAPLPLAYAAPDAVRRPSAAAFWSAVVCGTLPLVSGTIALGGYLATKWEPFLALGLITLVGGPFVFLLGVGALVIYVWSVWRPRGRAMWRRVLLVLALLLINWPVAFVYAAVGSDLVNLHD